ncbi:MAG: acyl--CoA ligase [Actinomycetaceae bacterium]|nr:acyl--CoA ligase [Actinomycetaceae bacterium]
MSQLPAPNIARVLDRTAFLRPDAPSLTYHKKTWTALDAALESRRLAQLLLRAGVSAGDRVMIISRNSPYHLFTLVACARIGAIVVPISPSLTRYEIANLVNFCAPRLIICSPEVAAFGTFDSQGTIFHYVIDDDPVAGPLGPALKQGYIGLSATLAVLDGDFISDSARAPGLGTREYPQGNVLMHIISGEASRPRAVCLSEKQLFWAARNMRDEFFYGPGDVTLVLSPMSSAAGLGGGVINIFAAGGHLILMHAFEPLETLRIIEEYSVTLMFGVPSVYRAILDTLATHGGDISSVRVPMIGGTLVPDNLLEDMQNLGLSPINVWGTAHMGGPGIYLPSAFIKDHPSAIGHPFPYMQARVVDPVTGEDVPDGEVGELIVRGPSVSTHMWHDNELTQDTFSDGWLKTGDYVSSDGSFLSLAGHSLKRIVTSGRCVCAGEVEDVLSGYDGLKDVVVCGIPDELWGETVVATIVLDEGAPVPTLGEVQEFCAQRLAAYKLPRLLLVLPEIPRTDGGEVDRSQVRDLAISPAVPEPVPAPITNTVSLSPVSAPSPGSARSASSSSRARSASSASSAN